MLTDQELVDAATRLLEHKAELDKRLAAINAALDVITELLQERKERRPAHGND